MTLPLENLLDRVASAARTLPGAVELYLFGSAADRSKRDAYADLDLQVVSADYALSRPAWPWIFDRVGVMALAYPVSEKPQESAFCIAFEQESPYHKLDIGLCVQGDATAFLQNVKHKVLLWRQPAQTELGRFSMGGVWMPTPASAEHFLAGELLGSVRYVKARKRGQHLTCWRFLSAKLNALLRSYAWDGDLRYFPQGALNTWDYIALDRALSEAERFALLGDFSLRSPAEMDRVLMDITRKIAARICPGFGVEESRLACMTREYLDFMEEELEA